MTELKRFQGAVAKHGSIRAAARALNVNESKIRRVLKQAATEQPVAASSPDDEVPKDVDELRTWATPRQLEILDAIEEHGGQRAAARALGLSQGTIGASLKSLKERAARMGWSPEHDMTRPVPEGFFLKGTSTYVDGDGKVRGQWIKNQIDHDRQREIFQAAADAAAEILPRLKPTKAPQGTSESLCNLYTFTDYHLGMLAWKKETGASWDLEIAERTLISAFSYMIDAAPAASTAFIAQLGDFMHSDGSGGMLPITPGHGHILDQDGRFSKIVSVAIRVLRRIVDFALARHDRVVVLMAEGNHDIASSVWLRALFRAIYENEPRVQIIDSELPYYVHQHGENMLGFHHGHLSKNESLPLMFAAKFPKVWGSTSKRVIHTGHRHHKHEKEHDGVTVVQHRTLAAPDSHTARHGYVSERAAIAVTYHTDFGEVARSTVVPEMFEAV
jgi:hypothetical protein